MAEQEGAAKVDAARQKTAQQIGAAQARLAAQGSDLAGSPLDVLGDLAAAGEEDALSLRYQSMRTAWENRARASLRPAPVGHYERIAGGPGRSDPRDRTVVAVLRPGERHDFQRARALSIVAPENGRGKVMGAEIRLTASDGGQFAAYLALPARLPAPALIVLPEVFNTNPHIRSVADGYAADGFIALAPDVFWRQEAACYLPYTDEGRAKARALWASSTPTSSPATWATSWRPCAPARTAPARSA